LDKSVHEAPPAAPPADGAEDDIIARARLNGLIVDPSALRGEDPFARRSNWYSALLSSGRGWVAAAIAAGVLGLAWKFSKPISNQVVQPVASPAQGGVTESGITRLTATNPAELKDQIVADLRAAGVEAIGYDRLGLSGVDAQLTVPVSASVSATLAKHGVAVPADGALRVEIAVPERK
jgi:hypothetical protein